MKDERYSNKLPKLIQAVDECKLTEFMTYQNLPVMISSIDSGFRLPPNLQSIRGLLCLALADMWVNATVTDYIYVTAKKGWATPDNLLNRSGWHCDGFGTDDINYIWSDGSPTRFVDQEFHDISDDHHESMRQFEEQIIPESIVYAQPRTLYRLDFHVVHSTPVITKPELRSFIKISFSNSKYNLENNSHNYQFEYDWEMHPRDIDRNHTSRV